MKLAVTTIEWRYQNLAAVASDFGFSHSGLSLRATSTEELKKSTANLELKYEDDLNANKLCLEKAKIIIARFKKCKLHWSSELL